MQSLGAPMPESALQFVEAPHSSPLYHQLLDLRNEALRKPLGLEFSAEEIAAEAAQHHFALVEGDRVIGCVVAVPLDSLRYKLRQMVVALERRGSGLGRLLLMETEAHLAELGATELTLYARDHAMGFYQKLGYEPVGELFIEVTIPHQAMRKRIQMTKLNPFHLAIQVHDLIAARSFYGDLLGCPEGRSSDAWVDFDFFGHQFVCHENRELQVTPHHNAVDGHAVPTPHFGVVLEMECWQALADRLRSAGVEFIIEPYVRFAGEPGEQATMFFCDPSGNALEFKAFKDIEGQLFAK